MRIGDVKRPNALDAPLPTWPPLLATRGPGNRSQLHKHHALHLIACLHGELRVKVGREAYRSARGVITSPDVPHAIDASDAEVLLVFIEPESRAGSAIVQVLHEPVRLLDARECGRIELDIEPAQLLGPEGALWTRELVAAIGGAQLPAPKLHPRVRKLLTLLRERPPESDASLEALAAAVGLSPSRLMHAFTSSVGVPLRPYLSWLRVQRAAGALFSGLPLAQCAAAAGFADSAHMTRTFRRMLGVTPSELRKS